MRQGRGFAPLVGRPCNLHLPIVLTVEAEYKTGQQGVAAEMLPGVVAGGIPTEEIGCGSGCGPRQKQPRADGDNDKKE